MTDQQQSLDALVADTDNNGASNSNTTTTNNNNHEGVIASRRSSTDSRASSAHRNPPARLSQVSSNHNHRQSFSESLRTPNSPRSRRQPSLPHSAIQSLIDNPPVPNAANPKFVDRDWGQISIGEVVSPDDLRWVEESTGIEEATIALIDSTVSVLLIRESPQHKSAIGTFDFSDLNAYLLLAAGLTEPDEDLLPLYHQLAQKAHDGITIPLRDVKGLGKKEPMTTLPITANVMKAVETFGGGVHRVVVVDEQNDNKVVGIFSQFRLVKFLWENGQTFPLVNQLYPQTLGDLGIGSRQVLSINADRPLCDALRLMDNEGISSVAVIDSQFNVVGNISSADVKLLTRSSSLPLLRSTCTHFISVILSTRGLAEGKDSFPVFHVNHTSTLAHAVAKMVATKSHRLWVTDPLSPSSSGPPTPSLSATHLVPSSAGSNPATSPPASPSASQTNLASSSVNSNLPMPFLAPHPGASGGLPPALVPSIPASALPGARLSGRLLGAVSLTDILNLEARASGLRPGDPTEHRNSHRRSSSSSVGVRRSGEVGRELFSRGFQS